MNLRQKKKMIKKKLGRIPPGKTIVPGMGKVTEKRIDKNIRNLENFIKIMTIRRMNK